MTIAVTSVGLWRNAEHRYWAAYDGVTVGPMASVTTAIAALAKPALIYWAVNLTAAFTVRHLDILNDMVTAGGQAPAAAWLAKMSGEERDKAATRGTDVHALCDAIARGEPVVETAEQRPYTDGFRRFLLDRKPRIVMTEGMVANLEHEYAGTFDLIVELEGKRWLIDIKTLKGGKGPYAETGLQLAAYAKAQFVGKPNDPVKHPMPRCQRFAVLALRPAGYELVEYAVNAETWQAFLAALRVSRWLAGQAKTIVGGGNGA